MSIEFRCTDCNKLLRTDDSTAGKQAKCPECGAVMSVPASSTSESVGPSAPPPLGESGGSPFDQTAPYPDAPSDTENPYASPSAYGTAPRDHAPSGEIRPTRIDLGDVLARTWAIFKREWGMCLAAGLIVFGINIGFNIVVSVAFNVASMMAGDDILAIMFGFCNNLITTLFNIWLSTGQYMYFLKVARGEQPEFGEIFNGGRYFIPVVLATILVILATLAGYMLCIIPGIIVGLMFSQYWLLIIDRNVGVIDSLSISADITSGNKLTLFAIGLVVALGACLVTILTCFVGILAVIPYCALLVPVIYLAMTGQATADEFYDQPRMQ